MSAAIGGMDGSETGYFYLDTHGEPQGATAF